MLEFRKRNVPVLYLKYEDIKNDNEAVMTDVAKFLLNVKTIEGTIIEQRIKSLKPSSMVNDIQYPNAMSHFTAE